MREKPEGYCHICGKYGKLSFEHIPPQKALNNNKAIVYTGENAIKRYKGENAKYKNQQQGMGGFTLCDSCNNNTGTWYAPVYNRIAKEIAQSLHKNKKLEHGDVVQFKLNKFPALSFVKQVVTMFCSLLPLSEVKKLGFDKFLLQKESNNIDNSLFDLRMYLTPFNVGQLMVGPTSIVNKTENGFETIIACDLGTYPFGFILNLTPEIKVEYGTSLMNLFDAVYDKEYSMNWPLMYLERTNDIIPIPLLFKPLPKSINDKTTKKNWRGVRMKIEGQINGFPLIKFKNTRIINSLKSGKIYLNSLKWFREYENELGDVVVGDSYEGMLHINEGELIIKETGEHHKLNDTIIPTVLSNSYVFCMTYIDPKNDKFEFDDEQKEELRNFGDTALVILDSEEFLSRIKKAAEEKGHKIYFNKVHYYDEKVDWADIFISLIQGTHNIAFWKRKAYSNQQEFRIVIPVEDYTEDHIELDIGDISDISKTFTTEQVLTMQVKKK